MNLTNNPSPTSVAWASVPTSQSAGTLTLLTTALVLLVSVFVFMQCGFNGELLRDDGIYLYSAQRFAEGVPPYVSVFDHKGPLSSIIAGFAVVGANAIGIDDIFAVRILFFAISCLTVLLIYLLASLLFSSIRVGLFSAFFFLNFTAFGKFAGGGPRAKTPMLLFEVLGLFLAARRNWFWAGFFGSLAALTWQPTAIYPLAFLVLAILQSEAGKRLKFFCRALAGFLLPLIIVALYYIHKKTFGAFMDGFVLFNITHLERDAVPFIQRFLGPMRVVLTGYVPVGVFVLVGFFAMIVLYAQRLRVFNGNMLQLLRRDAFAGLLITFPFPVVWSCVDFQGPSDFYVFLPYVALTIGWLLNLFVVYSSRMTGVTQFHSRLASLLICVVLISLATHTYSRLKTNVLLDQRRTAQELERQLPTGTTLVSMGTPQIMALLHRVNPNPYLFIMNGVDNRIDALTPGGFDGWLSQLESDRNSVIVYGGVTGRFQSRVDTWLNERWTPQTAGNWLYYVSKTSE